MIVQKNIANINIVKFEEEIRADQTLSSKYVCVHRYFQGSGNIEFEFSSALDAGEDTQLDSMIASHTTTVENKPLIHSIVDESLCTKHFHSINYKTEIINGIKLHPVFHFSNDGFIEKTEYYKDYVSPQDMGTMILCVEEVYTTDPNHAPLDPTARSVVSRQKTRKWNNDDQDDTQFASEHKITNKIYDSRKKQSDEGKRRRNNVVDKFVENTATAGVIMGSFSSENDAFEKLTVFSEDHNSALDTYIRTGRGSVYTDIDNDVSNAWLNDVVPDNPVTQAVVPWMIGMSLRQYTKDKLKGLVK
jgi:hypothetical protein